MKNKVILWIFLLLANYSFAQNALVEMHFEEAEKAYNEARYEIVLQKLDDVEKIAGSSSKTLYLRIVAQDKLLTTGKDKTTAALYALRSNAETYLDVMAEYGLDERYREVFAIQEKYKSYPDHPGEWPVGSLMSHSEAGAEIGGVAFLDSYEFYDEQRFYQLYPTGKLQARGELVNGRRVGMWELYDATDNLVWRDGLFEEGNSNVTWREYAKAYKSEQQRPLSNVAAGTTQSSSIAGVLGGKKKNKRASSALQDAMAMYAGAIVAEQVTGGDASPSNNVSTNAPADEGFSFRLISSSHGFVSETIMKGTTVLKVKMINRINGRNVEQLYKIGNNSLPEYLLMYVDNSFVGRFNCDEDGKMLQNDKAEYERIMTQL